MTSANQPETRGKGSVNGDSEGTLLAAVDFAEDSCEAVLWASREAEHLGCGLMILHVVHDPASSPGFYRHVEVDWLRPMADLARAMMDAFLKKIREEHPSLSALATADAKLVTGLPASRIVEVAKSINAPLIVIGSRGRTGLTHILLGSVAERVVQLAPMPVVVVKGHEEGNGTAH